MIGQEIVERLEEATKARAEASRLKHQNKDYNQSSQIGWLNECFRRLVLLRLMPEEEALPDNTQIHRFNEGDNQEALLALELENEGYKLTPGARKYNEEFKITGEVEYLIEMNGDTPPLDFKSCSSYMFKHISRLQNTQDLLESPFIWIRHYPVQMWSYELLYKQPLGILLFKDKEIGLKHTIDIPFCDLMDKICEGLLQVNEAVRKGEIPKPEYKDACKYCNFSDFCFPEGDTPKEAVPRVSDEEAVAMANRYCEIEAVGKEFVKLKKELTEQFRGQDVMIEDLLIKSSTFDAMVYFVPKDIKEQYADKQERTRVTLRNTIKAF